MKASPKGNFHRFFSPLHSHQKALPFGNLRRATLPFLILRQQDSVFLDYLPDGQPSGLLLAMFDLYYLYASINKKTNCGTYKLIYNVCDCADYVCCNRQASDYDVDSLNGVIYLQN